MSDTNIDQPSSSFDDATDGSQLIGAAVGGSASTLPIREYQPVDQADDEEETSFNGTQTERPVKSFYASKWLGAQRERLGGDKSRTRPNLHEAASLNSSHYGSCNLPGSGRIRGSCCDGIRICLKSMRCFGASMIIMILSLTVAMILFFTVIHRFSERLKGDLALKPNNTLWEQPTGQVFLRMYYFNLTNINEVIFGREMPIVHEVGPFVYRGVENRTNLTWARTSVRFTDRFVYKLDEQMSAGLENAEIMSLDLEPLVVKKANRKLSYGPLFRKFMVKKFMPHANYKEMNEVDLHRLALRDGFAIRPFDRKNGTEEFKYAMQTGINYFSYYYNIYAWNNMDNLPFWYSDEANHISGSDGTAFPPFLTRSSRPVFFDARMYRKFTLQFQEETTFNGVNAHRFIVPDSEFVNGSDKIYYNNTIDLPDGAWSRGLEFEEEGNGYCTPICVPDGLYSIRTIKSGHHPLFMSNPHFLGADPYYSRLVHGVQPDESKHRSIFDVHELTGQVMRMVHRAQTVFFMNNHLSEIYLPLFWRETEIQASQEVIDAAESLRLKYNAVLFTFYFLMVVVGLATTHAFIRVVILGVNAYYVGRYVSWTAKSPGVTSYCQCCTSLSRRSSTSDDN